MTNNNAIIEESTYHDYADVNGDCNIYEDFMDRKKRGGHYNSFIVTLHYVLESIEKDGLAHVVSWQPHGRCFMIRDRNEFVEKILKK